MPAQGTRWPPVGVPQAFSRPALPRSKAPAARPAAGTGHAALALSLLAGGLRRLAALLTRRLLLAAGWLAATARRQRVTSSLPGWRPFLLRRWHLLLGAAAALKLLRLGFAALRVLLNRRERRQRARLRQLMQEATTYEEWAQLAVRLDELSGCGCAAAAASPKVSATLRQLEARAGVLAEKRAAGDLFGLMFALRVEYIRQAGTAASRALMEAASHCPVVPAPVQRYIGEVCDCVRHIAGCAGMAAEDRQAFLRELRHAYGRTGLVLSGGGSFGFWHFGVVRALLEAGVLPRVVSGSSAGSIGGSLLCTRTDAELHSMMDSFHLTQGLDFFRHTAPGDIVRSLVAKGCLQDHDFFSARLRKLLGDTTFLDAFLRTGRILSIAVTAYDTHEPSRLLNYLTAPNVLIWSAVACSSAFPFLFEASDLMARDAAGNIVKFSETGAASGQRRWCDGSLEEDLPMRGLSQQFGVSHYLVSQCNPWLLPLVALKEALPHRLGKVMETELKHRCEQLLHFWPKNPILRLLAQPWEGDITFTLPHNVFPGHKSAANFSSDDIWQAMREGQLAVWAKLPAIQAACAIEVCIDQSLREVTREVQAQLRAQKSVSERQRCGLVGASPRMRASLPSWLHMPSLGLPPSDSLASMASTGTEGLSAADLSRLHSLGTAASLSTATAEPADRQAPASPRHPLSRLRRGSSGTSSTSGSREGSRHGAFAAGVVLGVPLATAEGQAEGADSSLAGEGSQAGEGAEAPGRQHLSAEEAAAEEGVQATAGALSMAGIVLASDYLEVPAGPAEQAEPAAAAVGVPSAAPAAPFEGPSEAWRELALLGSIASATSLPAGGSVSVDFFAY